MLIVVVDVDCSRLRNLTRIIVLLLTVNKNATQVKCRSLSIHYELIRQKQPVAEALKIEFLSLPQLRTMFGKYQTGIHNRSTPILRYRPQP